MNQFNIFKGSPDGVTQNEVVQVKSSWPLSGFGVGSWGLWEQLFPTVIPCNRDHVTQNTQCTVSPRNGQSGKNSDGKNSTILQFQ